MRAILILVAGALCASPAWSAVISVNFYDATNTLLATDTAGVVPVANWNNWADPGNTVTGSISALQDSSGATTSASIAIAKSTGDISNGASGAVTANGPNHVMMSQGFGGGGSDASATHGLYFRVSVPQAFAAEGLNVYLYHWSNLLPNTSGSSRYAGIYRTNVDLTTTDGSLGSSSFVASNTVGDTYAKNYNEPATGFAGTYFNDQSDSAATAGPSNYTLISLPANSLNATSGVVSFDIRVANSNSGVTTADREWINGIQIQQVPEPSSICLIVLGAVILSARRAQNH